MNITRSSFFLLFVLVLSFTVNPFIKKYMLREFTTDELIIYGQIIYFFVVTAYAFYLLKTNKCDLNIIKNKITFSNFFMCIISAIIAFIGALFLTFLLQEKDTTFIIPHIQPVVILLTMILGILFTNEYMDKEKFVGTVLIILGLIFINHSENRRSIL